MVINADRCSWFFGFLVISGTSWMLSSIYWTKRSTIISHIHSKCYTFAKWIRSSLLSLFYCLITRLIGGFDSCYSFVSVIHLLVGVVYCLVSWSVGLPKRAVSISFFRNWLLSSIFKVIIWLLLTRSCKLFASLLTRSNWHCWPQSHSVTLSDMSCPMFLLQLLLCLLHTPLKVWML